MLVCVRWYAAYPLSLRNLEEMMAERGVIVDHATVHRWALKILPVLGAVFRRRKRPVGSSWRVDETYIKVGGRWKYLYRAVDRHDQQGAASLPRTPSPVRCRPVLLARSLIGSRRNDFRWHRFAYRDRSHQRLFHLEFECRFCRNL